MDAPSSSTAAASHAGADTSIAGGDVGAGLAAVRARIGRACAACGRPPSEVSLVAVSKFHPIAAIRNAIEAGQLRFGENRVQEALQKFGDRASLGEGVVLHLIGTLQTNKVRDAVRVADVIESLDRAALADAIERAADREGRLPRLLVQVNVGDEAQKSGIPTAEADEFVANCVRRFGAAIAGLMCVPPVDREPRPLFAGLRELGLRHGLATLSMGMSDDLEAAIAEGATEVRVGTAIFGSRPPVR